MGEIGLPEEKFFHIDKLWKLQAIIRGYRRRTREDWMRTRLLMFTVSKIAGGKAESPEDMLPLPFDKQEKTEAELAAEQQQLEQLMKECQEYNQKQAQKKDAHE